MDYEGDVGDGIKKKLNESILRGVKVRVEDARPDTFVPGGVGSEVKGRRRRGSVLRRMVMVLSFRIGRFREGRVSRLLLIHPQREMASGIVFSEFPIPPPPSLPLLRLLPRGPRRDDRLHHLRIHA